jgi:hypothetical protein
VRKGRGSVSQDVQSTVSCFHTVAGRICSSVVNMDSACSWFAWSLWRANDVAGRPD